MTTETTVQPQLLQLLARGYAFPLPDGGYVKMTILAKKQIEASEAVQLREFFRIVVDALELFEDKQPAAIKAQLLRHEHARGHHREECQCDDCVSVG